MTQQKSEDGVVPEGPRKGPSTRGDSRQGGGKAVPVKEAGQQLMLPFATAENPRSDRGADSPLPMDLSMGKRHEAPKAKGKRSHASPATKELVAPRQLSLPWITARS
jgi:hypothetical protein